MDRLGWARAFVTLGAFVVCASLLTMHIPPLDDAPVSSARNQMSEHHMQGSICQVVECHVDRSSPEPTQRRTNEVEASLSNSTEPEARIAPSLQDRSLLEIWRI